MAPLSHAGTSYQFRCDCLTGGDRLSSIWDTMQVNEYSSAGAEPHGEFHSNDCHQCAVVVPDNYSSDTVFKPWPVIFTSHDLKTRALYLTHRASVCYPHLVLPASERGVSGVAIATHQQLFGAIDESWYSNEAQGQESIQVMWLTSETKVLPLPLHPYTPFISSY